MSTPNQTERKLQCEHIPVTMVAVADQTTEHRYWAMSRARFESQAKSRVWWEDRPKEQKETLKAFVRQALSVASDTVDDWLPTATRFDEHGDRLTIMLSMLHIDVDEMTELTKRYTTRRMQEMRVEALALLDEDSSID